jgi:hypothetical protein
MMYLLQSSIIFAVMASNIQYHWTPNGSLLAGIAAYVATALLSDLIIWLKIKRTGDSR